MVKRPAHTVWASSILLAGCSAADDQEQPRTSTPQGQDASQTAGSTYESQTAGSTSPSEGSANPRVMSEDQLDQALSTVSTGSPQSFQDSLEQYWESTGLSAPRPEVEPIRVVSLPEGDQTVSTCMEQQGFPSSIDANVQEGIEFSREQEEALQLAQYTCFASYPLDDKYFEPYSVEQLKVPYDWNVNEVSRCLRDQDVDPAQPPTFQVFVEEYAQTGQSHWTAGEGIDMTRFERECPQEPPDDVLYP